MLGAREKFVKILSGPWTPKALWFCSGLAPVARACVFVKPSANAPIPAKRQTAPPTMYLVGFVFAVADSTNMIAEIVIATIPAI